MEKYDTRYAQDDEIRAQIRAKKKRDAFRRRCISAVIAVILVTGLGAGLGHLCGRGLYAAVTRTPVSTANEDVPLVKVAASQLGNEGGEPYWKWYDFDYRVEWCGCFVSWCEDRCGLIESGKAPKFAMVGDGAAWFEDRDQWIKPGGTPADGDLIFFDLDRDGSFDHVGIVSATDGDLIFTVEGNSSDLCRQKRYRIDDPVIGGYGRIK